MSDKVETIERWVREYEEQHGELPTHNKGVLRQMFSKEYNHWEGEEGRVLKDSNRYHDDN
jgi:hypothetical protein